MPFFLCFEGYLLSTKKPFPFPCLLRALVKFPNAIQFAETTEHGKKVEITID
ncbi:hypothetical protein FTV88_0223 [Heliorestis convoluta]|uniref:Uncharacterized protein n=1 Tax=Heliorestis convoluta TaxID=356322 RepID=A0A5Q2MZN3_9FIRM|nr:hypothetical protein FTV88_0223 [Heliorestis convoluta]